MKIVFCIIAILAISACQRLDSLVFLGDNTISSYKLNNYDGDVEFDLPPEYDVTDSMVEIVTFNSKDKNDSNFTLYGIYIDCRKHDDTVIVYCHGQRDHIDFYWGNIKLLANLTVPYDVFMFDYKGYGLSEGISSEDAMYEDTKAALSYLKSRNPGCAFIIMGSSLGSAPATYAAAFYKNEFNIAKLILESPFASADNLTQESTIINTSAKYFVNLKLNNAEWIKEVDAPLLWMHGIADDYIAISNGEIVYKNYPYPNRKMAIRVEGAKHGSEGVAITMGWEEYRKALMYFMYNF